MVRHEESAEQIRRSEVSRTLGRMSISSKEEEAIEHMSRSLVDRILHNPLLRSPRRGWRANKGKENSLGDQQRAPEEMPQRTRER